MVLPTATMMMLTVASQLLNRQVPHNTIVSPIIPANGTIFDYIIVGGGTAGCVVAGRLAELSSKSILLLEAGGPQTVSTDMPGNTLDLVGGEFDWNYHVATQRTAGLSYPNFTIPRGRVLGGSSVTNWDIYNRGNPQDFDSWATDFGLTNMTWQRMQEFFYLFENETDRSYFNNGYHHYGGPVSVSTETFPDQVLIDFQRVMNQVNISTVDINGETQLGTAIAQMFWNDDTAIKSTTANSYLENVPRRPNLTVLTRTFVRELILDTNRVMGVRYEDRNGEIRTALATTEVIVSGGPINTPQILINSGIGPIDHLQELDIPVVRNLSVGENLHDMVFVPLYYRINDPALTNPFPSFSTENLYNYFVHQQGPLAHHADGVTYRASNGSQANWPNTMIIGIVEFFNNLNGTVSQYAQHQEEWRAFWSDYERIGYYLALDPVLARPTSRGRVRLDPQNRYGMPIIDPRYLETMDDFNAIVDTTEFVVRTLAENPLYGVVEFPPIPDCTACNGGGIHCMQYIQCYVRQLSRSYYNFVGTARMGLPSNSDTVVDPQFRVIGFNNLRVVDASVIPRIPNAHTNAVTIALAEMAARLIKNSE